MVTATSQGNTITIDLDECATAEREYLEAQDRGFYFGRQWPCVINGVACTFNPQDELPGGLRDELANYAVPCARAAIYAAKDRIYARMERSRDITGYRDQTELLNSQLETLEALDDLLVFTRSNSMTMLPPSDPESGVYTVVAPKDAPIGKYERLTERPMKCGGAK